MLAIRNKQNLSTSQMRKHLKTIGMGLGLVRLLQDAGRAEEARTTLASLQNGVQGIAQNSGQPRREHYKANRLECVPKRFPPVALTANLEWPN